MYKKRIVPFHPFTITVATVLPALFLSGCSWFSRAPKPVDPTTPSYRSTVSAFYSGLAALQAGDNSRAEKQLVKATELAPDEPATWANLGILQLRLSNFEAAGQSLEKARALAPQNSRIETLLGLLQSSRGQVDAAVQHLQRAVELDPENVRARYALVQQIERQAGSSQANAGNQAADNTETDSQIQNQLEEILKVQPDNAVAAIEVMRLAARRGQIEDVRARLAQLATKSKDWPALARTQLAAVQASAAGKGPRLAVDIIRLKNALAPWPAYQQSLAALESPSGAAGEPFEQFIVLPSPTAQPSPPDEKLTFAAGPIAGGTSRTVWAGAVDGVPQIATGDGKTIRVGNQTLAFPAGPAATMPAAMIPAHGVLQLDWNYDFKIDLAFAGAGGLRLWQQAASGTFTDVTPRAALPAALLNAEYSGAWAADIEADGDLDIVLGTAKGAPLVLRNNGGEPGAPRTFGVLRPFSGINGLRDFAGGDFDGDGDVDAAMLDAANKLNIFANERGGVFQVTTVPASTAPENSKAATVALAVVDADNNSILDLLALDSSGVVTRYSNSPDKDEWVRSELLQAKFSASDKSSPRLLAADLDNNGQLDIIVANSGNSQLWLGGTASQYKTLEKAVEVAASSIADVNSDGRLDLIGTRDGKAVRLINKGTKQYHWQVLRPRAAEATGDQRINSFGIGGEMELRAGLLFQKQPITGPQVHFGLGDNTQADVVRIIWPNGAVQAEFELKPDQSVLAEQRLTGSCPYLFAWDGKAMSFVKDVNWRSPLGLRINAQDTAGIVQTEDWAKLRSDQLVARDGFYDLRVTADLWEAHIFDEVALLAVDHPAGTEVHVDERFSIPMPPLRVTQTGPVQAIGRAWDDRQQDVTDIVSERDGRYLDTFGKGTYQGVTRAHFVEVELGDKAPRRGPLWLIAEGWLQPTDSSINVALAQSSNAPPQGLSLEVANDQGGWTVARTGLGFPSGKNKTILVDLKDVFRPGAPQRLRLRTNLEIYWDKIGWATGVSAASFKSQKLPLTTSELRYRGFSRISRTDRSSPELPESYDNLERTTQRWRDLIGYYTRFGDVRELLQKVDDRYVIMNAGDEMVLRFKADAVPEGWVRDFVFISDGWTKDGNLNTGFSKTLLPLPSHDRPEYSAPPGELQDDPVYRRYPNDWEKYHTRYVTPRQFQYALQGRN